MGGNKSKNVVYTVGVPDSEEIGLSAILRSPQAQQQMVAPTVWGCNSYYSLFQYELHRKLASKHPNRPFIGARWTENSDYQWLNYRKSFKMVNKVSAFLKKYKLTPDPFFEKEYQKSFPLLGFLSYNRIEWLLLEIACMNSGIVTVGLYENLDNFGLYGSLINLKYLFCPADKISSIVQLQKKGVIGLEYIIVVDVVSSENAQACVEVGIKMIHFEEMIHEESVAETVIVDPNDPCFLSLTSGTTTDPKFCIISHLNLMSTLSSCLYISKDITKDESYLSYLNMSTLTEKMFIFLISANGGKIGFARSQDTFHNDVKFLKPTVLIGVPRLLEFLHTTIKKEIDNLSGLSKTMYLKGLSAKLQNYESTGKLKHKVWDPLVFKKSQKLLGGRLKFLIIGSTMCNKDIINSLRIHLGCYITEGYGLIESTGCTLCAFPNDINCGYIGGPLMNIDIRLHATGLIIEDYDYYYGELCIKGDPVSGKYYGVSGTSLDSKGWLRTGDLIALLPENGALKFIDRIEYISKSKSGKCVCVQKLELLYRQSDIVAQILCVGSNRIEGTIAIVVPNKDYVMGKWKGEDFLNICRTSEFMSEIIKEFLIIEKNYKLKEHERVLKVHIETEPWVSDEYITPTLKTKRNKLLDKYYNEILSLIVEIA